MKTRIPVVIALVLLALSTLNLQLATCFAQGSLTPPGAPAPTMKSLDQIEPRAPISSLPYTITNSGSYYVTTNLTGVSGSGGININAGPLTENVTVDLNGFTLTGVAGSGNGISTGNNGHNYVIRNGTLRNWGTDGVNAYGSINCRFERLQFYANGNIGLQAGMGSVVSDCEATSNTVAGIQLSFPGGDISHCVAVNNGIGIQTFNGCVLADCTASGNSGDGINVGVGTGVRGCTSYQNGGNGVATSDNCSVIGCTVCTNYLSGISVSDNCTVKDCTSNDNDGSGILTGNNCTVKDCTASGNGDTGLFVFGECIIKDCSANGNFNEGIYVAGPDGLITGNICCNNDLGMWIDSTGTRIDGNFFGNNNPYGAIDFNSVNAGNCITRNSAPGGGYDSYSGNNDYAPIQTPNTATSPWANF